MKASFRFFLIALVIAAFSMAGFLLVACGDDDDDDDSALDDDDDVTDDDDDAVDDDTTDDDDDSTTDPLAEAKADPGNWHWYPVDGAYCRDGSQAGFGIRVADGSKKLALYLEGGGVCTSEHTCSENPDHADEDQFFDWVNGEEGAVGYGDGSTGVFDTTNDTNPVKDWTLVYVAYCTGDHHAGSAPDATVEGVDDPQQFVGYRNIGLFLELIAQSFPDLDQGLIMGMSAGAVGTFFNYIQVAEALAPAPVSLLCDSGVLVENDVLAPCWQKKIRDLFNMEPAIPADCTDCTPDDSGDGLVHMLPYLSSHYPQGTFGIYSSVGDELQRTVFGEGENDCTGTERISEQLFKDALLETRTQILVPTGKWSTYFITEITHTALPHANRFYGQNNFLVGDTTIAEWMGNLLDLDGSAEQIGP